MNAISTLPTSNADSRPLILHVIHHLLMGGMENGLVNLINNIPESKYRHAIACIEDYSDFRNRIICPNVEVFALKRSKIGVWRLRRELFELCRRLKPTIVHTRNQSGLDALLPARLAGVPHCIHGEHGWDVDNLDGKSWKPKLLRQLHSPFIEHYITVSKHLQDYLIERVGIKPSRISHIYNGVDTNKFFPLPVKSTDFCLPQRFQGKGLVLIGTVGRIEPVKDQATLLRGFAKLVATRPHLRDTVRLAIIGGGALLSELQSLAETLNLSDLTWFSGAIDNIPDVLRLFDLFVLPSLNEGISNTLLEAMSCGVPIVATAVGGNIELVEEGVCGRLFEPGDIASLQRILAGYLDEPELMRAQGQTARKIALERFSLNTMVENYLAAYDRLTWPRQ